MKILNLPLKAKWYDMIESGEKRKRDSYIMEKPRTFVLLLLTMESVCREARRLFSLPCPSLGQETGQEHEKRAWRTSFFRQNRKQLTTLTTFAYIDEKC